MSWPETLKVMSAFEQAGEQARFIGGCVRDSILKRPVQDIDIATPAQPERVMEILAAKGIHVIPTGIDHGTVTAIIDHEHFEITTLRIDHNTDGRRAQVTFTDDWTQDAARRDFTINAMSCDLDGNIYDPYDGLKDLSTGYIRFVGHAHQRIEEDVLRLLRFFRFLAVYGKYPVNSEALDACHQLAPRLNELSGERVRGELFRILMARNPATTFTKMRAESVLNHILPEAGDVGRLRALAWLIESGVKIENITLDPVRRLAALLSPNLPAKQVKAVAERLKFSNVEKKHLLLLTHPKINIDVNINERDLRKACYLFSGAVVMELALLAWAGKVGLEARIPQPQTQAWIKIVEYARDWKEISFPLRGRDVINLGVPHGPAIGSWLSEIQDWWISEDFQPTQKDCFEVLKKRIKA